VKHNPKYRKNTNFYHRDRMKQSTDRRRRHHGGRQPVVNRHDCGFGKPEKKQEKRHKEQT
jgi:hypothetical protein